MEKLKKHLSLYVPIAAGIAFALLAWHQLSQASDLLYAAQEHSLWYADNSFMQSMLQQPGGIFSWAGRYLTQFFFHPELGILMLILLWLVSYALLVWGSRLPWWGSLLALTPFVLLLNSETSVGYYLYQMKVPDWWFTPTLFVLFVCLLIAAARWLTKPIRLSWQIFCVLAALGTGYHWADAAQVPDALRSPQGFTVPNSNFLAELRMEHAAIAGDWRAITSEAKRLKEKPTRQMYLYNFMALFHSDRITDEWLHYPVMTQVPQNDDPGQRPLIMLEVGGVRLYFLCGIIQFAYRWSMEEMVEFGPTVRNLRQMTECALITGETELAHRYIEILKRSTFHRDEALELEHLLKHPQQLASDPRYRYVLDLATTQSDMLDSDNSYIEKYLWERYSTQVNGNHAPLNLLCMHFTLATQNIERFWNQFFAYAHLHRNDPSMPRLYQEAAYLYSRLEPDRVDVSSMPFDPEVRKSHESFMQRSQQYLQKGYRSEQLPELMRREFGQTFYWFYYFCRDQSTY